MGKKKKKKKGFGSVFEGERGERKPVNVTKQKLFVNNLNERAFCRDI